MSTTGPFLTTTAVVSVTSPGWLQVPPHWSPISARFSLLSIQQTETARRMWIWSSHYFASSWAFEIPQSRSWGSCRSLQRLWELDSIPRCRGTCSHLQPFFTFIEYFQNTSEPLHLLLLLPAMLIPLTFAKVSPHITWVSVQGLRCWWGLSSLPHVELYMFFFITAMVTVLNFLALLCSLLPLSWPNPLNRWINDLVVALLIVKKKKKSWDLTLYCYFTNCGND